MKDIDARRLSRTLRTKILERDNGTCMYCLEPADEVDHIIPWSFRHDDSEGNLVAACWLCNHIASNKMFDDFIDKRKFIIAKKNKILKKTIIPVWTATELMDMGPGMKTEIVNNCIVAADEKEALKFARRIAEAGLEVRVGI